MLNVPVWITIITSLFSGIIGALLSSVLYIQRDKRQFKLNTIRNLAANRYDLLGDDFSRALNEVIVVFSDSPAAIKAVTELQHVATSDQKSEVVMQDKMVSLFKALCTDAGIKTNFNDSAFLVVFNSRSGRAKP